MPNENKIKYGLKNVHVAKLTETTSEAGVTTYSYGTPKRVPGAVNLSMSAEGSSNVFRADDTVYFRTNSNNGYSGTLELALVPDWFAVEFLGMKMDGDKVLVETSESKESTKFAMLFEFAGDQKATRHVLYCCSASRSDVAGQTKEEEVSPQTETLNLTADPRGDGAVRCKTSAETPDTVYNSWYTAVHEEKEVTGG